MNKTLLISFTLLSIATITFSQSCPGNLVQNNSFSNGLSNWQTFSGFLPNPVPNNSGCLDTFMVLRANDNPKYCDGMEQTIAIDSGKCYDFCACIAASYISSNDVQIWALKNNFTLTFDSLLNNTFPPGDAQQIGVIQVTNTSAQQYCINGWYAQDSFTRLVIFNSTSSPTNASVNIDNICLVPATQCASCKTSNLQANFSYTVLNGSTVQFTNTSSGNVIQSQWNFGDAPNAPNDTSTQPNPVYTFSSPGAYFVCLKVLSKESDGAICKDSVCFDIDVYPPCDTTGNGFTFTQSGDSVWFSGTTGGTPISWSWNFGDPSTGPNNASSLQNPLHVFSASGSYIVCLIIGYSSNTGIVCSDTICKNITIVKVGIKDALEQELKSFPNPAETEIYLSNQVDGDAVIYSLEGKKIKERKVHPNAIVSITDLPNGFYVLQFFSEKGIFKTLHFTVHH